MSLYKLFINRSIVKVIDFLLENRFWDYSKSEIAKNSGISRETLYKIWHILEKYNLIITTTKLGYAKYKANMDSEIMKNLSNLSLEKMKYDLLGE